MRIELGLAAVLVGCPVLATTSFAHVTLAVQQAPVGAEYKATFRVPHGCKGSATVKLTVQMPDGVLGVKPQPKPGWQIDIVKGAYDKPYHYNRAEVTEGVKSVSWSGGNLPDDYYDEFVLIGYLDKGLTPGSRLYFPTLQICKQGSDNWVEKPAAGHSSHDYKFPAPFLKLLPAVENAN
jgi:periplasmic copper chaperone A